MPVRVQLFTYTNVYVYKPIVTGHTCQAFWIWAWNLTLRAWMKYLVWWDEIGKHNNGVRRHSKGVITDHGEGPSPCAGHTLLLLMMNAHCLRFSVLKRGELETPKPYTVFHVKLCHHRLRSSTTLWEHGSVVLINAKLFQRDPKILTADIVYTSTSCRCPHEKYSWYNIMHPIPELHGLHGDLLLHQSTEMSSLRYFRQDENKLRLLKSGANDRFD